MSATRRGRAANALLASAAAMVLAGCASARQSGGNISQSGTVAGAGDSCTAASPPAYLDRARTVFIGTALPGPTANAGSASAVLVSPAHFRVLSYLKGDGPRVVTVQTALTIRGKRGCRGRGRHRAASRAALENLYGLAAHALPDLSLRRLMRNWRSGR